MLELVYGYTYGLMHRMLYGYEYGLGFRGGSISVPRVARQGRDGSVLRWRGESSCACGLSTVPSLR